MGLRRHGNLAHNRLKLQRQTSREDKFLLLSAWTTYVLYVTKELFTATVLRQNYHWTDGFFLKNHPLKEAERQYKFCFRAEVEMKGAERRKERSWHRFRPGSHVTRGRAASRYSHERLPSMPGTGSKRLTRPLFLCLSSLSSCILQESAKRR